MTAIIKSKYFITCHILLTIFKSTNSSDSLEPELHIGGFFIVGYPTLLPQFQRFNSTVRAAYAALEHINTHPNRNDILQGYTLRMTWQPSQCDGGKGLKALYDTIYEKPTKVMLFGPLCSSATQRIAETAVQWDLITTARTLLDELKKNDIEVIIAEVFDDQLSTSIANIKQRDARIIIGSFHEIDVPKVFCEIYKHGLYGPKYVWLLEGWLEAGAWHDNNVNTDCNSTQLTQVAEGYFGTDWVTINPDMSRVDFGVPTTPEMAEYLVSNNNHGKFPRLVYDGIWAVALTLNATIHRLKALGRKIDDFTYGDRNMSNIMAQAVYDVEFNGYTGHMRMGVHGRQGNVDILRLHNDTYLKVGTFSQGKITIDGDLVKWRGGRVPRDSKPTLVKNVAINTNVTIIFIGVASLGIVGAVGFLVYNITHRHERLIRMSSPNLNNLIVIGCILIYAEVILMVLNANIIDVDYLSILCKYMFEVVDNTKDGIVICDVGLKCTTVDKIVSDICKAVINDCTGVVGDTGSGIDDLAIKDITLYTMIFGLLAVDMLLLGLWEIFDPLKNVVTTVVSEDFVIQDEEEVFIIYKYYNCRYQYNAQLLGTLFAYKGVSVEYFITDVTVNSSALASLVVASTTTVLCIVFLPKIAFRSAKKDGNTNKVKVFIGATSKSGSPGVMVFGTNSKSEKVNYRQKLYEKNMELEHLKKGLDKKVTNPTRRRRPSLID
ncbi:gamma-aminobutyric acid type B receptor subunit 2-like [Glandiceps talaboti]